MSALQVDRFIIGVDVGSTTTDLALINHTQDNRVETSIKTETTRDIMSGILNGIEQVCSTDDRVKNNLLCIIIGTTHFVNALLSFSPDLDKVAVCRLTSSANECLPPCASFPPTLKQVVFGDYFKLDGGYEVDGREMYAIDREQVGIMCEQFKEKQLNNIVISGVFSPMNDKQEEEVASLIREFYKGDSELKITCSHNVSELGFIQRENAAILNASLKGVSHSVCYAFQEAIRSKYDCPFFLTQNDGTLISPQAAMEYPIFTVQSGPTNSMKGAAVLSKIENAIVVDIGGLTTDVGMLVNGFPRLSNTNVSIGNVATNFRVPDVYSVAMGGGSIVSTREVNGETVVSIGPQSVGYNIFKESLIFGGQTMTTTDAAVASGLLKWGRDEETIQNTIVTLEKDELSVKVMDKIHSIVEEAIEHVKTSSANVPVILVGGASVLVDEKKSIEGVSQVLKPTHYQCANAVGAALAQVSGRVDHVVSIESSGSRELVIENIKKQAIEKAVNNGANPETVEIIDFECIPLAYIPGDTCRFICKAVGKLDFVKLCENTQSMLIEKPDRPIRKDQPKDVAETKEIDQKVNHVDYKPTITFNSVTKQREWTLTTTDIDYLEVGSGIISTGGGGSPKQPATIARNLIQSGQEIKIITPNERMMDTCFLWLSWEHLSCYRKSYSCQNSSLP